jgi:hypothetical protein
MCLPRDLFDPAFYVHERHVPSLTRPAKSALHQVLPAGSTVVLDSGTALQQFVTNSAGAPVETLRRHTLAASVVKISRRPTRRYEQIAGVYAHLAAIEPAVRSAPVANNAKMRAESLEKHGNQSWKHVPAPANAASDAPSERHDGASHRIGVVRRFRTAEGPTSSPARYVSGDKYSRR